MITYNAEKKHFIVDGMTFLVDENKTAVDWPDGAPFMELTNNIFIGTKPTTVKGAWATSKHLWKYIWHAWTGLMRRPNWLSK